MNSDANRGALLNTVIVDDEQPCRETLSLLLSMHCPQVRVIAQYDSIASALAGIESQSPDLVFLDIMLPDGMGFDLLRQIGHVKFKVIFTTAHDEYAIRAIRLSALDYLMKPVLSGELRAAVERATQLTSSVSVHATQLGLLHDHLSPGGEAHTKIALPTLDGFTFIELRDIVVCEARRNYTECVMTQGEPLLICRTLKEFEELLSDRGFFRIHQSHIINLQHLRRFVRGKGGYVVMSNGREFEVSARRKEEFIRRIGM